MKAALTALTFLLAGCGGSGPAANKAEQLENAAEQSTPGAAQVLENAADSIREGDELNPDVEANRAMNQAANVAASEP
jgi:hypothetical protein